MSEYLVSYCKQYRFVMWSKRQSVIIDLVMIDLVIMT